MGFRGKGRKLMGCRPPLECDEGKNEWSQRNLTQSSQGFIIPETHRRRDSSTILPMIWEGCPFPQRPLLRLISCTTHAYTGSLEEVYGSPNSLPREFRNSARKAWWIECMFYYFNLIFSVSGFGCSGRQMNSTVPVSVGDCRILNIPLRTQPVFSKRRAMVLE